MILPDTPEMVMKGQVAKLSGFQEDVGTEMVGTLMVGLTMLTGGMMSAMSLWVNTATKTEIFFIYLRCLMYIMHITNITYSISYLYRCIYISDVSNSL